MLECFIQGYKPAYLCPHGPHDHELFDYYQKLISSGYPFVQIRGDLTLFFQSNDLREQFLERSSNVEVGSPKHHRILGESLGYPPIAAKFFADCWNDHSLRKKAAIFHYSGIKFMGCIDDQMEIAQWLWDSNYPLSDVEIHFDRNIIHLSPNHLIK